MTVVPAHLRRPHGRGPRTATPFRRTCPAPHEHTPRTQETAVPSPPTDRDHDTLSNQPTTDIAYRTRPARHGTNRGRQRVGREPRRPARTAPAPAPGSGNSGATVRIPGAQSAPETPETRVAPVHRRANAPDAPADLPP
ncbi:hypothetical protein [Streptomyces sp. NPDC002276]